MLSSSAVFFILNLYVASAAIPLSSSVAVAVAVIEFVVSFDNVSITTGVVVSVIAIRLNPNQSLGRK